MCNAALSIGRAEQQLWIRGMVENMREFPTGHYPLTRSHRENVAWLEAVPKPRGLIVQDSVFSPIPVLLVVFTASDHRPTTSATFCTVSDNQALPHLCPRPHMAALSKMRSEIFPGGLCQS